MGDQQHQMGTEGGHSTHSPEGHQLLGDSHPFVLSHSKATFDERAVIAVFAKCSVALLSVGYLVVVTIYFHTKGVAAWRLRPRLTPGRHGGGGGMHGIQRCQRQSSKQCGFEAFDNYANPVHPI